MRVGVICDGSAEVEVLQRIVEKIDIQGVQFTRIAYADIQPLGPVMQIVAAARPRLAILRARGSDRIIVVVDRETLTDCPGVRASNIEAAFRNDGHDDVMVVIKNRKLENWLIAHPEAVASLARFRIPEALVRRILSAGADSIRDAYRELNGCCIGGFSKRRDAVRVAEVIDPVLLEQRSRSFRKFLRAAGDPRYRTQSNRVARPARRQRSA